jgi:hypothetical protein
MSTTWSNKGTVVNNKSTLICKYIAQQENLIILNMIIEQLVFWPFSTFIY